MILIDLGQLIVALYYSSRNESEELFEATWHDGCKIAA